LVDWAKPPIGGQHSHYYHPFNLPEATQSGLDLLPYWLMGVAGRRGAQRRDQRAGRGV